MKNLLLFGLTLVLSCNTQVQETRILNHPVPLENRTNREWISGWLEVPENRKSRNSSRIELPFVLSKAVDSLKSVKPPILIMSGGPGNSSLHMANGFTQSRVGRSFDVLVMDQRGTYYAKPYLSCPEVDSARINGRKMGWYGKRLDSLHYAAVARCYKRLSDNGTDLNAYHTLESAQDIENLRSALGISQLILYGMSYSCKLMAAYAREYPDRVRALILDSPLPHQSNYDEEAYGAMDSLFRSVLNHYSGDKGLYQKWTDYIIDVQHKEFRTNVDSIEFGYSSNEIIDAAMITLESHGTISELPDAVERLISGNHEKVSDVLRGSLKTGRQAKGMRYSTWIAEELPDENPQEILSMQNRMPWLKDYPVNDITFETAKYWKVSSVYDAWNWPSLPFDGPVLILSGGRDPWTPVQYGLVMQAQFSGAELMVYSEYTHLPGFSRQGSSDILDFVKRL